MLNINIQRDSPIVLIGNLNIQESVLILNLILIGVGLLPIIEFVIYLVLVAAKVVLFLVIEITDWTRGQYSVSKLFSFVDLCPNGNLVLGRVFINTYWLICGLIFQTLCTF
jgi:hypothetical protein